MYKLLMIGRVLAIMVAMFFTGSIFFYFISPSDAVPPEKSNGQAIVFVVLLLITILSWFLVIAICIIENNAVLIAARSIAGWACLFELLLMVIGLGFELGFRIMLFNWLGDGVPVFLATAFLYGLIRMKIRLRNAASG
jgi:hypothetical protein